MSDQILGLENTTQILDRMPVACIITDESFRIRYWNRAAVRTFGYTAAEALGKTGDQLIIPQPLVPAIESLHAKIKKGETDLRRRDENITKDGRRIVCDWINTPLSHSDGQFAGLLAIGQDITEAILAQKELQASEAKLKQITAALPGVVYQHIFNADGTNPRLIYISEGSKEIFGVSASEAYQDRTLIRNSIVSEDLVSADAIFREAIGKNQSARCEMRFRAQNEEVRWLRSFAIPHRLNEREILVTGLTIDVTEEHNLHESLLQAQKMESIGRLAGGIAHDFNNLLTVMLGYSETLLDRLDNGSVPVPVLKADLNKIRLAAQRGADLTNQLLTYSRKQVVKPAVLDVAEEVTQAGEMFQSLIGEGIDLSVDCPNDTLCVRIDRGHFHQILMNLIVNARDAMPQGGRIKVSLRQASGNVRLRVADSGLGMDEETRSRIFDPFFTTKNSGSGTGLGLFLVFGIVRQAGGSIEVESEVGKGTIFNIYLPLVSQRPRRTRKRSDIAANATGHTVMVVDDESDIRDLIADLLIDEGYRVFIASKGDEALTLLSEMTQPPDLMITDVVMPGMGGRELVRHARAICPNLKVVYTSGFTKDALGAFELEQDDASFLQKPFSTAGLQKHIRAVLSPLQQQSLHETHSQN